MLLEPTSSHLLLYGHRGHHGPSARPLPREKATLHLPSLLLHLRSTVSVADLRHRDCPRKSKRFLKPCNVHRRERSRRHVRHRPRSISHLIPDPRRRPMHRRKWKRGWTRSRLSRRADKRISGTACPTSSKSSLTAPRSTRGATVRNCTPTSFAVRSPSLKGTSTQRPERLEGPRTNL